MKRILSGDLREITVEPALDPDHFIVNVGDTPRLRLHRVELTHLRDASEIALLPNPHDELERALLLAVRALRTILDSEPGWAYACDLTADDLTRLHGLFDRVAAPNRR